MSANFESRIMELGSYTVELLARADLRTKLTANRHLIFRYGTKRMFAGVITETPVLDGDRMTISGPGIEWWLGDAENRGPIREPVVWDNLRTDQIFDNLLFRQDGTRALNPGILNLGNQIDFEARFESSRSAIRRLAFDTQTAYRVNPDFTVDWEGNGSLFQVRNYVLSPEPDAGTATEVTYEVGSYDVVTKAYVLGPGEADEIDVAVATGAAPGGWKDWNNQNYQRGIVVGAPNIEDGDIITLDDVAVAQLGAFGGELQQATATLMRPSQLLEFDLGDSLGVYKPPMLIDTNNAIIFRGRQWPAVRLQAVALMATCGTDWSLLLRHPDGTEEDISRSVIWDSNSEVTVELSNRLQPLAERDLGGTAPGQWFDRRWPHPIDGGNIAPETISGAQIADEAISIGKLENGLQPIKYVTSLPTLPHAEWPVGRIAWDTSQNQLFRSLGSTWEAVEAEAVLTANIIEAGHIKAGIISVDKLVVGDFSNLAENGSFELEPVNTTLNPGTTWFNNSWVINTNPAHAHTGGRSLKSVVNTFTGFGGNVNNSSGTTPEEKKGGLISCRAGDRFYGEMWIKDTGGASVGGAFYMYWYDANFNMLAPPDHVRAFSGVSTVGTAWTMASGQVEAPAGAAWCHWEWEGTPTTNTYIDDIFIHRVEVSAYIADAAIITQKLADGSVTNLKVVDIVASKLTAGTINAAVILSGYIATSAGNPSAYMDSTGFHTRDSGGVERIHLRNNGSFYMRSSGSYPLVQFDEASGFQSYNSAGQLLVWLNPTGYFHLRNAVSGARIHLDVNGLYGYNSSGQLLFEMNNGGGFMMRNAESGARIHIDHAALYLFNSAGLNTVMLRSDGYFVLRSGQSGARLQLESTAISLFNGAGIETVRLENNGGFYLRNSNSGARIQLDTNALYCFDSGNNARVELNNQGALLLRTAAGNPHARIDGNGLQCYDPSGNLTGYFSWAGEVVARSQGGSPRTELVQSGVQIITPANYWVGEWGQETSAYQWIRDAYGDVNAEIRAGWSPNGFPAGAAQDWMTMHVREVTGSGLSTLQMRAENWSGATRATVHAIFDYWGRSSTRMAAFDDGGGLASQITCWGEQDGAGLSILLQTPNGGTTYMDRINYNGAAIQVLGNIPTGPSSIWTINYPGPDFPWNGPIPICIVTIRDDNEGWHIATATVQMRDHNSCGISIQNHSASGFSGSAHYIVMQ
jgi:hypothetical protein